MLNIVVLSLRSRLTEGFADGNVEEVTESNFWRARVWKNRVCIVLAVKNC